MKSMYECVDNYNTLAKLFKKAIKYEFYSLSLENYTHKACATLNKNSKYVLMHTTINFKKLIPKLSKGEPIDYSRQLCGFYKNNKYEDEWFNVKIMTEMEQKNIICVIFNIYNYLHDGEYYAHHCTTGIFYPCGDDYNFFYLNPHGKDSIDDEGYIKEISQFRKKKIELQLSRNLLFIQSLIKNIQRDLDKYDWNLTVHFDDTKNHNYYGPNLQKGDGHGICFTFPLIVWYYLIQGQKKLLDDKRIMEFMLLCHCVFDIKLQKAYEAFYNYKKKYLFRHVKYKTTLTEEDIKFFKKIKDQTQLTYDEFYFIKSIEDMIEKRGTYFIKRIVSTVITLLTQKQLRDNI